MSETQSGVLARSLHRPPRDCPARNTNGSGLPMQTSYSGHMLERSLQRQTPVTNSEAKGHTHEPNRMSELPPAPGGPLSDPRREKKRDHYIQSGLTFIVLIGDTVSLNQYLCMWVGCVIYVCGACVWMCDCTHPCMHTCRSEQDIRCLSLSLCALVT